MSNLYLGIDGGQSSTKALIATEDGRIVGHGTGGPCNHVSGPEAKEKFRHAIGSCIQKACDEARLDSTSIHFSAACVGFSGGIADKDAYARELIRSDKHKIVEDTVIALSGATEGHPGIIVIAGTGSAAFGVNGAGKTARAGGWGYIFGDEGGAFDLVRQALRAALQFEEGWGAVTVLRERLLAATGARDANDLLHRFYTPDFPRDRVATFAPLVTEAAMQGDQVARMILRMAGGRLASLAGGVYQHLFQKFDSVPVCYVGGVFRSDAVRASFVEDVKHAIGCDAVPPRYSPVAGAVLEALRLEGKKSRLSNVPESER